MAALIHIARDSARNIVEESLRALPSTRMGRLSSFIGACPLPAAAISAHLLTNAAALRELQMASTLRESFSVNISRSKAERFMRIRERSPKYDYHRFD